MTNYEQLLPRERGWLGYSELWANGDHLLQIRSSRFAEDYQRFRWKDIQSLSLTTLPHGTGTQWAVLLLTGFTLLAGILLPPTWGWRIFFSIPGLLSFPIAVRELSRGPKCRVFLHTAAGAEALSSIGRISAAQTFLDLARPRIAAIQGDFAPGTAFPAVLPQAPARPEHELPAPNLNIVYLLFGLWLANSILTLAGTYWDQTSQILFLALSATIVELVLVILALRQFHSLDYLVTRRVLTAGFVCQILDWIIAITYLVILFRDAPSGVPTRDFLSLPYAHWSVAYSASWRVLGGLAGYWSLRPHWRKPRAS